MDELEIFLRICLFGFSIILSILALLALRYSKGTRLLFAFAAFVVFAFEGFLLVLGVFFQNIEDIVTTTTLMAFNLIILILFYGSVLR